MPKLGDTFLGGREVHGVDHLWIVINDPARHNNRALIVPVSTLRMRSDTTCVLRSGEHPFIRHDSYIRFRAARIALVDEITTLIMARRFKAHQPADAPLVDKIRAAAAAALEFPSEYRAWL